MLTQIQAVALPPVLKPAARPAKPAVLKAWPRHLRTAQAFPWAARSLTPPASYVARSAAGAARAGPARWISAQPALAQGAASVLLCALAARLLADQLQRTRPGPRTLRTLDIASGVGVAMGVLALGHRALVAGGAPPWAPPAALWGVTMLVSLWEPGQNPAHHCANSAILTVFATGVSCLGLAALNLLIGQGLPEPLALALWAALPAALLGYEIGR